MNRRWDAGFTILELLVTVFVIGILAGIGVYAYSSIQRSAAEKSIQSDLTGVAAIMQQQALKNGGTYPTSIPVGTSQSSGTILTVIESDTLDVYSNLSNVQTGVLLAQICQDLINEGVGQGINQGGTTESYITGCGNWNDDSMQVTGWNSKVFSTPVEREDLLDYAETFTTNNSWNKAAHEGVVKNFYGQMVERLESQGGSFPVTSFWDYWATPLNGGVMMQPLPSPLATPYYCIEAHHQNYGDLIWHITDDQRLYEGPC